MRLSGWAENPVGAATIRACGHALTGRSSAAPRVDEVLACVAQIQRFSRCNSAKAAFCAPNFKQMSAAT